MPFETAGSSPRNIGTQCDNIDVESVRGETRTVKTVLKKYFYMGVRTSDPLLNVIKWIAYFTEVSLSHKRDLKSPPF